MELYFQGGETSDHRKRLVAGGVKNIALSYWGLQKRIKEPINWRIKDKFPDDVSILLDSGAFSASKKVDYTDDDWINYIDGYMDFVEANIDRISMVTEFDAKVIEQSEIARMREDFWDTLPVDKFMPVWHEAHGGLPELSRLAQEYDRIAITNEVFATKRNLSSRLNALVGQYGTKFHGMAITKPDELRDIRFSSVSSTSWVSPMRYGDTIVWDGTQLRRYPVKYKDQARKRHRTLFEKHGFDAEKIANDDPDEVTALSIWSWLRFEERLNNIGGNRPLAVVPDPIEDALHDDLVATWAETPDTPNPETPPEPLATSTPEMRNLPAVRGEGRKTLPVFGITQVATHDDQGEVTGSHGVLALNQDSVRLCDSCHLATRCPEFSPGSTCAYKFPVEIKGGDQLQGAMTSLLEMQMGRVAFGRFAEELEGGYPDPNVSTEIDRFFKLAKAIKDINDNRESFKIQVEGKAQAGVLSRIFGERNVPRPGNEIDPQKAEAFLGDVMDAEIVEDD
jgi:hypothetical protein